MKSHKIKVCAEIDAPMAAGLSQHPKLRGGEERWVEVTLRDSGCRRHTCSAAAKPADNQERSDGFFVSLLSIENAAGSLTRFFFRLYSGKLSVRLKTFKASL